MNPLELIGKKLPVMPYPPLPCEGLCERAAEVGGQCRLGPFVMAEVTSVTFTPDGGRQLGIQPTADILCGQLVERRELPDGVATNEMLREFYES